MTSLRLQGLETALILESFIVTSSDGLHPSSDGLQLNSDGLHLVASSY